MSQPRFDVVVCGAGPAGSIAAARAAAAGMRVALIEKCVLPRYKTCGGGMPMVVSDLLPQPAAASAAVAGDALAGDRAADHAHSAPRPDGAFVEADVQFLRHTWNFADACIAPINPPGCDRQISIWMVQRAAFDHALAQRAAAAGAELRDGLAVRSIERDHRGVTLRAESSGCCDAFTCTADHVIGADGATSLVARSAGLRHKPPLAVAMEIEHPHDWGRGPAHLRPEVAHLEYGAVPGGYAWVFPKADHLNIGAGVLMRRRGEAGDSGMSQHLRRVISRYPAALRIDDRSASCRVHAHPIPTWRGREPLNTPDGRVLLVGDAAGLVNPFFGDGILYAMHSGRIAADCLARGAPHEYTDCVHTQFAEKLDAALALARIFYRRPHFCYRFGVRLPEATRVAARVICGDAVITDVRRRVWHYIREALAGRRVAH